MSQLETPSFLKPIAATLEEAGFACYLVGGAVRNLLLAREPVDFDLATDATPQEVMRLFRRTVPTGIEHGTVTILQGSRSFEITTFRVESDYSDARHPDSVSFTRSIHEDLKRRDFTVNGMAIEVSTGALLDPHDGRKDLEERVIRAIGNPAERFDEDGLRLLRAVRFAGQLEFEIEQQTEAAIKKMKARIGSVSAERVRDELVKIVQSSRPSLSFSKLKETGLLDEILPELSRCDSVPQGSDFAPDVFTHSVASCDGAPADNLVLRLAALLHDLGKWDAFTTDPSGGYRFYGHESASSAHAEQMLSRLRFSNAVKNRVVLLVREHMFNYDSTWSDAAVRRLLARVGGDGVEELILLRQADLFGKYGSHQVSPELEELRLRVQRVVSERQATRTKDLAVNGNLLNTELGIPKAPVMGRVLDYLLECVIEEPQLNSREQLLKLAKSFYERVQANEE